MRISIIGSGYVGLCTGVGFALKGNQVICADIDREKVEKINKGISPIYEPGLDEKLREVLDAGRFRATKDINEAVRGSEVSFMSVGTPSRDDGSIDLKYIEQASRDIGNALKGKDWHVVVVKSTVVPGTTEGVVKKNLEEASGKKAGRGFGLYMNPEFLREGKALEDFLNPDRVVIGELDKKSGDAVAGLYQGFDAPVMRTGIKTAEMIKYASNALLATKISFINEIGNICKKLGIDTYDVAKGMGMDKRISPQFLQSGLGWGGSCFLKDVAAIVARGRELGCNTRLLDSVMKVNEEQPGVFLRLAEEKVGPLQGRTVAILGLTFKPDSDDIRESRSIPLIKLLKEKGARVVAYDPKAMENVKTLFPDIEYAESAKEAVEKADIVLIATAWEGFKEPELYENKMVIDGRNIFKSGKKPDNYEGLCW